jgi:hypothetical protein
LRHQRRQGNWSKWTERSKYYYTVIWKEQVVKVIDDRGYPVKCIEWWKEDGGMFTVADALEYQNIFMTIAIKKGRSSRLCPVQ